MGLERVVARRRARREELLDRARHFVRGLDRTLPVHAAVVFGSVARGDFNQWSDIDLLIVAGGVGDGVLERLDALPPRPPLLQPVVWTPSEWKERVARGDPIAREAATVGVWLLGSAAGLA